MIGRTISHFEILAELGAGGMGVVYRARDTRLDRQVAFKVLPPEFVEDTERLARFEREAKVLASLSHANIAGIYEVGHDAGIHYLAMELAEGETLAERLQRGPLALDVAVEIALGIAEGLDAAHERGIVHRDLKPGNVMVDPADAVKLLDFGLAKAYDDGPASDTSLSHSPTLTARMTQAGVILGTAAYMSPEQARGKRVDKRADIWAFGCILFEMLSGRAPFGGRDVAEVLAAVIRADPDLDNLPPTVPADLRCLIGRCLRKEPRRRVRDIGDARNALEEIGDPKQPVQSVPGATPRGRLAAVTPWVLAGLLAVLSAGLALMLTRPDAPSRPARRFAIDLPWHSVPNWSDFVAVLSPTGDHIAYNGRVGNEVDAYIRPLDRLDGRAVIPARESVELAFSPDGEWLAVLNDNKLSRVPVHGGQPIHVADLDTMRFFGLSWGSRGDLLIGTRRGLLRLPATGGPVQRVAEIDETAGDSFLALPRHLPDGNRALVALHRREAAPLIGVVDLNDGRLTRLPIEGSEADYSPTGHLVVRQRSTVVAFRFDPDSLAVDGEPVVLFEEVESGPWIARDGTMLYIPTRADSNARLVWTDRSGRATPVNDERRDYSHLDLASDGRSALLNVGDDLYTMDLGRGTRQRLASDALFPILTPDDRYATAYHTGPARGIVRWPIVGGGEPESLVTLEPGAADEDSPLGTVVPTSWNPRTGDLAFFDDRSDIWIRYPDGSVGSFLATEANERTGRFSPDGQWLAYVTDETGEYQVFVIEYPGPGRRIGVSVDGGLSPIWSADGRELFFRNGGKLMVAAVTAEPQLTLGVPIEAFDGPYTLDLMGHQRWDASPDGQRFLMVENSDDFRIVVVEGRLRELE